MTIIAQGNFFGLYAHSGRHYNMIMTLDNNTFKYSEPGFARTWKMAESIPEEVLKLYLPKEKKALANHWLQYGYCLEN